MISPQQAKFVLDYTGADGVMIGRGALGRPWVFQTMVGLVEHNSIVSEPSLEEKCGVILQHKTISPLNDRTSTQDAKSLAIYLLALSTLKNRTT